MFMLIPACVAYTPFCDHTRVKSVFLSLYMFLICTCSLENWISLVSRLSPRAN